MERAILNNVKLYLGPMSKNIVNSIIEFSIDYPDYPLGFVASRRQIDHDGGYVNNWTTQTFARYVRHKNPKIAICRDHGGPNQGKKLDNGGASFLADINFVDLIHIDPFKYWGLHAGIGYTLANLNSFNAPNTFFEVGTEESICKFTPKELYWFLDSIQSYTDKLDQVAYAVIQAGTSLKAGINTGTFDKEKMLDMIDICNEFGVLSKEHNGDYQSPEQIKEKFNLGLSAINIAPELAHIETSHILKELSEKGKAFWFASTIHDGQWKKWFPKDFKPHENKELLLKLCGHYVLTDPWLETTLKSTELFGNIKADIYKFLLERLND